MKRKWLCLAVAAGLLATAGCGNGGEATDAGQSGEITVSIFDRGLVSADEGTYENNRWTRWIGEQSGVDIKWIPIPRNEARQKFNMLAAADSAPDIMVDFDPQLVTTMKEQNVIMPIDDMVNTYSTVYKEYLEEHANLKQYVTFDGNMYAATSQRPCTNVVNMGVWIRQDWLDKLGLPTPTTDEELFQTAMAFKTLGNDITPIAMLNQHEIFPSMYQASAMWYNENGVLKYGHTLDRYGASIEYMKRLYDNGLIDKEFVTDKDNSRQKQLWTTGKAGILTYSWTETLSRDLLLNDPDAKPVPLKPVSTQYGLNAFYKETDANTYVVFNKKLKYQQSAMKFLDWVLDTGWFNLNYGLEGEHHRLVNGKIPQIIDQDKFKKEVSYANEYAIVNNNQIQPDWIPYMAAQDELSQQLAQLRSQSLALNNDVPYRRDLPVDPQLDTVTRLLSEFAPLRDTIRIKAITGGAEYSTERAMEEIRAEWNRLGGEQAEKEMNEWYQANNR